jgi:hypothetical protein
MNFKSFLFCAASVSFLFSCQPEKVNINYEMKGPRHFELVHNGHFATMDNGLEKMGTVTKTYTSATFSQQGEMLYLDRSYVTDNSKGYHQNSMPEELGMRIPEMHLEAKGPVVYAIKGYEKFSDGVVKKLMIPTKFRNQLMNPTYPAKVERIEQKRWLITHLLQGEVPTEKNITSMATEKGWKLPPWVELDSVVTGRVGSVEDRQCLEYDVYYREKVFFPYYLWEQWAYSTDEGKDFKNFKPEKAQAVVDYKVFVDITDGVVCREQEKRKETHTIKEPESGEEKEFIANVFIERLYTEEKKGE